MVSYPNLPQQTHVDADELMTDWVGEVGGWLLQHVEGWFGYLRVGKG